MKTYKILKARYHNFFRQVNLLNKRAKKLGCESITVNVIREYQEPHKRTNLAGKEVVVEYLSYVEISLTGQSPKLNGWEVLAILSHTKQGNLLRVVPGKSLPTEYRTREAMCDHCNTKRYRTDTYVLQNEKGETVQVGSKCLRDFLGHASVEALAKYAELLLSAESKTGECSDEGTLSHSERSFNLLGYLPFVSLAIEQYGWLPRSAARANGGSPTADVAFGLMMERKETPSLNDIEKSYSAIEWTREALKKDNLSDYEFNLKQIVDSEIVDYRGFGFAASIISYYNKAMQTKVEASVTPSEHFGTEGKREVFTLKLLKTIDIEGSYGLTTLHKFEDEKGNKAIWFSSNGSDMEIGQTYKVKATVKKHDVYKEVKQTNLSRCVVVQ